jgi:hypothetical protein
MESPVKTSILPDSTEPGCHALPRPSRTVGILIFSVPALALSKRARSGRQPRDTVG